MQLHEAIVHARKELKLSQKKLSELAGIQRRQLATLEAGGNVTLSTLRKVLAQLPNLQSFSLEAVRVNVDAELPPDERKFQNSLIQLAASMQKFAEEVARRGYPAGSDPEMTAQLDEQIRNLPRQPTREENTRAIMESSLRQVEEERNAFLAEQEERIEREVRRRLAEVLAKQ